MLGSAEHFSCSFVAVHVPAPYVHVGVTTASNGCYLCRGKLTGMSVLVDVWRMRTKRISLVPVHERDHLLQILDFSFRKNISACITSISISFNVFVFQLGQNFRFVWANFEPLCFCNFVDHRDHYFQLPQRGRHHEHVVSKTKVGYAVSFFVTQFHAQARFVPSFNVLLHC